MATKGLSTYAVALALFVVGCQPAPKLPGGGRATGQSTGDFSTFLTNTVYSLGGHINGEHQCKQIVGTWWYFTDQYGMLIESRDVSYEDFDSIVKCLYGEPSKFPKGQRAIPARTAGVVIWYDTQPYGLRICINKRLPFQ